MRMIMIRRLKCAWRKCDTLWHSRRIISITSVSSDTFDTTCTVLCHKNLELMYTGKSVHILHIKYLTLVSRWNLFCTLPWMGTCQCEAGAAGTKLAPATPCLSSWGCTCYMSSDHSAHFENTTQWKLQHVNAVHRAVEVTGDLQKKRVVPWSGAAVGRAGIWYLFVELSIESGIEALHWSSV